MQSNQPELEIDLSVEHNGHRLRLTGRDPEYVAEIPSIGSLIHFFRAGWRHRRLMPSGRRLTILLWKLRVFSRSGA
jgi:hypothetical protein